MKFLNSLKNNINIKKTLFLILIIITNYTKWYLYSPLTNYKFFERRVEYKTEELEYSKEEEKLISEIKSEKNKSNAIPS